MIDFRYHLISIIAIFLALAAGVALGAGPLNGSVDEQLASGAEGGQDADVRAELDQANGEQEFQSAFATSVGSDLLSGSLQGRTVALFVLPGAESESADGLAKRIDTAGGSVTARVELTEKMIDPSERQFAEGVARQSLDGNNTPDTSGMSSYELLGTGLSRAFLASGSETKFDGVSSTVTSAYSEAGFIATEKNPNKRASLAVFVTGGAEETGADNQDELVAEIAAAADNASAGAVVAGPPSSATDGGVVAYVRDNAVGDSVSTVDAVTVPAGQIVTALALQREAGGNSGHFGKAAGADSVMPN